jgi:hypothetical protein
VTATPTGGYPLSTHFFPVATARLVQVSSRSGRKINPPGEG